MPLNLAVELSLRPPRNVRQVVGDLRRSIEGETLNLQIRVGPEALSAIRAVTEQASGLGRNLKNVSNEARQAEGSLARLGQNSALAGYGVSASKASTALRDVGSAAREGTTYLGQFGEAIGLSGRRFAAFVVASSVIRGLIGTLQDGASEALQFEREMVKFAQVSGATRSELKEVSREITGLSTSLGVSSRELARTSVLFKQAGLSIEDVKLALGAVAKASLSPEFGDLKSVAEGLIAVSAQFGLGAKDFEKTLSSINTVSAQFAVESKDIIEAVKRTGGAFKAAGGDLNEFIGLFTAVRSTTRESAETIATGLRTIFTKLQRAETVEQLEKLGVQLRRTREEAGKLGVPDLTDQFVGPFEAVKRVSEALGKLRPTDPRFAAIVEEIGDTRQISKAIPLIQQLSKAQEAYNLAQYGTLTISASADKAQEALLVRLTALREKFLSLFRTITESTAFNAFANSIITMAGAATRLLDSISPLIPALTALAGVRLAKGLFGGDVAQGFQRGVTPRRFARGGLVPGSGDTDSVPAMLEPGEFVLRKRAVQSIGKENLEGLNEGGRVREFASGGHVIDRLQTGRDSLFKGARATVRSLAFARGENRQKLEELIPADAELFASGTEAVVLRQREKNEVIRLARLRDRESKYSRPFTGRPNIPEVLQPTASDRVGKLLVERLPFVPTFGHFDSAGEEAANTLQKQLKLRGYRSHDLSPPNIGTLAGKPVLVDPGDLQKLASGGSVNDLARTGIFYPNTPRGVLASSLRRQIEYAATRGGRSPAQTEDFISRLGGAANIEDILQFIPTGSRYLGAGSEALALRTPQGNVVRVAQNPVFRANHPRILKPLTSISAGGFTAEELPFAPSLTGLHKQGRLSEKRLEAIVRTMRDRFSADRLFPADIRGSNLGLFGKRIVVTDPHAVLTFKDASKLEELGRLGLGMGHFAKGGRAGIGFNYGGSNSDTVPAMLTPGEFVVNKESAQKIGYQNLNKLNNIKGFADGGVVGSAPLTGTIDEFKKIFSPGQYRSLLDQIRESLKGTALSLGIAKTEAEAFQLALQRFNTNTKQGAQYVVKPDPTGQDPRFFGTASPAIKEVGGKLEFAQRDPSGRVNEVLSRRSLEEQKRRPAVDPEQLLQKDLQVRARFENELTKAIQRQILSLDKQTTSAQALAEAQARARLAVENNERVLTKGNRVVGLTSLGQQLQERGLNEGGTFLSRVKQTTGFAGLADVRQRIGERLGGISSTTALLGLPALSGIVENAAGSADDAVRTGREGRFQNLKGVSGAFSGALAAGFVGGAVGGVPGALIGGGIGAVAGFINALKDGARDIRDAKIKEGLNEFGVALTNFTKGTFLPGQNAGAALKTLQEVRQTNIQQASADATGFFGGFDTKTFTKKLERADRDTFGQNLPQIVGALNKSAADIGKANPGAPLQELTKLLREANGGLNRELLGVLSALQRLPVDEVIKDFARAAKDAQENQLGRQAGRETAQLISNFAQLGLAVQATAQKMGELESRSQVLSQAFQGQAGPVGVRAIGGNTRLLGAPDPTSFREGLAGLTANLGAPGEAFRKQGEALDNLARVLPEVLSKALSQPLLGDQETLTDTIRQQLRQALPRSPENDRLIGVVARGVSGQKPEEFADQVRGDVQGAVKRLIDPLKSTFDEVAQILSRELTEQANRLVKGYGEATQRANQIIQERFSGDTLRVGKARFEAGLTAEKAGRRSDALDFLPLDTLNAPLRNRQEALTGFAGAASEDPARIAGRLSEVTGQLRQALEERDRAFAKGEDGAGAAKQFAELQNESSRLTQALRNLTNVSERTGAAQEKLAKIEQDRQGRLSLGTRFLGADLQGRQNLARDFSLLKVARAQGDNINNFPIEAQQRVVGLLQSLGNVKLSGLGGANAQDYLEKLIRNSPLGGIVGLDKESQTQKGTLEESVRAEFQRAVAAQEALVGQQERLQAELFGELTSIHQRFANTLQENLLRSDVVRKQTELGELSGKQSELNQRGRARQVLQQFGVDDQEKFDVFQKRRDVTTQFFQRTNELDKVEKGIASARRGLGGFLEQIPAGGLQEKQVAAFLKEHGLGDQADTVIQGVQAVRKRQFREGGPRIGGKDEYSLAFDEVLTQLRQEEVKKFEGSKEAKLATDVFGQSGANQLRSVVTQGKQGEFERALGTFKTPEEFAGLDAQVQKSKDEFARLNGEIARLNAQINGLRPQENVLPGNVPAALKPFLPVKPPVVEDPGFEVRPKVGFPQREVRPNAPAAEEFAFSTKDDPFEQDQKRLRSLLAQRKLESLVGGLRKPAERAFQSLVEDQKIRRSLLGETDPGFFVRPDESSPKIIDPGFGIGPPKPLNTSPGVFQTLSTTTNVRSSPAALLNGVSQRETPLPQDFGQSSEKLAFALVGFSAPAQALAKAIEAMPTSITMEGRHEMNVNLNGAEALAQLEGPLKDFVLEKIEERLTSVLKDKLPDAGPF